MAVLGLRFCARAFCSCGKWGTLFIAVRGPLIIAASPVAEHRLQTRRLSNCGSRTGPVAPRHVGSSQTRARTRVPCIGRQIPNHCATREALLLFFNWSIVDLQCCVSCWCTAKWFSYTYILLFRFFSIIVYYEILNIVSCAIHIQ